MSVFMSTVNTDIIEQRASKAGRKPGRRTGEVISVSLMSQGVYQLVIRDPYIARTARPAQFVNLYSANAAMMLPRPFGIAKVEGDDVTLIYQVVGAGTEEFSGLRAGDRIDVLGPLGKPFDLDTPANYVLVGGGLGVPPLLYAAQTLSGREDETQVTSVFGYRDDRFADETVKPYASKVYSIVNAEGNVIDLLNDIEQELTASDSRNVILSCGPTPMMKAVAGWASKRGIPAQFSLESRMGCGYGACVACVVDTPQGRLKVCKDGPVFTTEQLGWDA
ncbi:dihydroorotate dehydrogenase electron transfer subunit [Bifidobacterium commune]|uniref:Dihydroorotate dehydrogenase electron transfer subunit n=1 Tax=Bifidobacterium commune TaxID=1505727 RepID=A0A1C4H1U7_9BIFI|nr:dihydroorotate dehydrogenase electron transfer subunit [Bifidobacterium commune]MBB2954857.1 dihydroorotate dehydrogenase electron transfer subunit [Bifidobacterium commune]SCC78927.1 dihydroorotate dehydrogenase electron transfer subunit [Bifidobacterium commune]